MHNSTCHKGSSAKRVLVPKGVIERADDTDHFSDCCHALLMLYFIVLHNNKVNTSLCASDTILIPGHAKVLRLDMQLAAGTWLLHAFIFLRLKRPSLAHIVSRHSYFGTCLNKIVTGD